MDDSARSTERSTTERSTIERSTTGRSTTGPRSTPAAVLWDFDGTLVDSEPIWIRTEYAMVTELGGQWNDELAHQMVGNDLRDTARHMITATGRTDLEVAEVVAELVDRVTTELREGPLVELRPGALELLADLERVGTPCALVSASHRSVLEAVLDRLPANPFVLVVAGDEVTHGKPHPEPYLRACAQLGVRPGDCVVLEDSITGADSGNAAGAVVASVHNLLDVPPAPRRFHLDSLSQITADELARRWAACARENP